jgi:hypothetical protein
MHTYRSVAVAIVLSLVIGGIPRSAQAAESEPGRAPQSIDLHASVAAAAARVAAGATPRELPARYHAGGGQMAPAGGGGGGKGMMIMTLAMTVVGIGATVYMLKQVQKQTEQTGAGQ